MKSIFEINYDGRLFDGMNIRHEEILSNDSGVQNPYAYRICLFYILKYLVRTLFSENDDFAVKMLEEADKEIKVLQIDSDSKFNRK